MSEPLSLFVSDNGAAGARLGGSDTVSGLLPMVFLTTGIVSAADGGLVMKEQTSSSGEDEYGKYEQLIVDYENAKGAKMVSLRLRARESGEYAILTGEMLYTGKPYMRTDNALALAAALPGFERGHGSERWKQFWTRPFFATSTQNVPRETQFLLWENSGGGYGTAIPLVGGGMRATMGNDYGFGFYSTAFHFQYKPKGPVPIFAMAFGPDPYTAVEKVYRAGMDAMGRPGRLRTEKTYPELFEYFGWCSWNAFYNGVSQDLVMESARAFRRGNFPVKYFVIDDGWQSETDRMLTSFDANGKFRGGLKPMISELKKSYGIKWVGVWHAFQGYWDGVHPQSELAKKYKKNLFETMMGKLLPGCADSGGYTFYYDYHESLRKQGVDFVKVDNQSTMSVHTMNKLPIADAVRQQQMNLQSSVNTNFLGRVINCMSMTIENVYFWLSSNVSRNSDDFFPNRPDNGRIHVLHNVYNSLWNSQLAYPDFDMFESHHPQALVHAVLRSISGGPVYVTDTPGKQNFDLLWKLVYPDGKILRASQPLLPAADALFTDVTTEAVPLKAFTTAGAAGAGVVGVFNVKADGGAVAGAVSAADVHGISGGRFAAFEHFSQKLTAVDRGAKIPVELPEFGVALYHFVPIVDGFAPIGLADKFLSGAAVLHSVAEDNLYAVDLAAPGVFVAWLEKKPASITVNGKTLPAADFEWKDSVLKARIPEAGGMPLKIKIKT